MDESKLMGDSEARGERCRWSARAFRLLLSDLRLIFSFIHATTIVTNLLFRYSAKKQDIVQSVVGAP